MTNKEIEDLVNKYIANILSKKDNNFPRVLGNIETLLVRSLQGDETIIKFMQNQIKEKLKN